MLKKRVVAALAAAMLAGTASAVSVNPGSKGEVLIAPMVMVAGGWTSDIRLVNSDPNLSTVVKVVFHDRLFSREVLDFLVFLSPGDVWTATAKLNPDGTLGIDSTDDSSLVVQNRSDVNGSSCPNAAATNTGFVGFKATGDANGNFASKSIAPTVTNGMPLDTQFTYATVFQARTYTRAALSAAGTGPVSKAAILAKYSADCVANDADPTNAAVIGVNNVAPIVSGDVALRNPSNGNKLSLPMTALSNRYNKDYLRVGQYTAMGGQGNTDTLGSATKSRVEDALWGTDFVVPFDLSEKRSTFATVTFPTKEEFYSRATNFALSQYFSRTGNRPFVNITARDESENTISTAAVLGCAFSPCQDAAVPDESRLNYELNIMALTADNPNKLPSSSSQLFTDGFTRGWVNLAPQAVTSTSRSEQGYNNLGTAGAPALVTIIQWEPIPGDAGKVRGSWSYAAKTQNPAAR